ncbi:anti-sigma factor [Arthrobacter sp. H20]|uniref:anti-sigma factor n=1 Tax=Arthrobacter sp. H20 TaxID=1267981 RepID=UPI00047A9C1B|nr:anti-sigma factor [Arthrobacter sp. H20]
MFDESTDDLQQDLANGQGLEWAEMYALNALGETERYAIDDYLARTDVAQREAFNERVRAASETLALAYAIDDVEPPAALFDRILAQLPGDLGTPGRPGTSSPLDHSELGEPSSTDELAGRRKSKQRRTRPVGRWLAAAAAAVVITVGGVSVAQNLQPTSVEQEVLQAQDLQSEVFSIAAGGTAELQLSRAEDAAVITLSEVTAPPAGKVYQMWRVPTDGSAPVSISTMTGDDLQESLVTTVEGIGSSTGFAITVEPDGGSERPTLPIVAEIPFRA